MQSVSHIFGGEAKVKIMRLFIFNPGLTFTPAEVASRVKERPHVARRELGILTKAGLIKRRTKGFMLDISYSYLSAIENFLIVGDHLKQAKLLSIMSSIEALLGKELRYAAFETVDFRYRLSIYDKLIKDILDYQHKKILNKLGI